MALWPAKNTIMYIATYRLSYRMLSFVIQGNEMNCFYLPVHGQIKEATRKIL